MSIVRSVRSCRKHYSITQKELAHLLALSQTAVSRLETNCEPATIETAFALQVIFGMPPSVGFPRLYQNVEEDVMARAAGLDRRLRRKTGGRAHRKRQLLSDMIARVKPTPSA
jgi:DNA-binding XRE family transcriptional regulator